MQVAVLVDSNPKNKTGYFNSTHQRIKNLQNHSSVHVFVIKRYDSRLLASFEKMRGKRTFYKQESPFEFDSIEYSEVWLKRDFVSALLFRLNSPILAWKQIVKVSRLPSDLIEADVISAHWGYPHGLIATILADKFNKVSSVTYHGSDIHGLIASDKKQALLSTQYALQKAGVNIFVSKGLEDFASKHIYRNQANSRVLYNTIDTNIFNPKNAIRKSKSAVVGFVGNLKLVKRADKLAEIFKHINALNPYVSFVVVGDGILRNEIERACISYNLPVTFAGKVNPSEIPQIMQAFDLLILPSRNEGLPMVLIEALALGTKALGADVGGIKEVLGEGYVVADGADFEHRFAQKAMEVLKSKQIPALDEKFMNDTVKSDEFDIYNCLLKTKNSR
jgi:glycosyltransferase involved in cell wall biosynthesis